MNKTVALIFLSLTSVVLAVNKYSAAANSPKHTTDDQIPSLRTLQKPFRMAKLNLLWTKAQIVRYNIFFNTPSSNTRNIVASNRAKIKITIQRTENPR